MSRSGLQLIACALALPAFAGAPSLEGVYSVGALGLVEFSSDEGQVVGRYRGGGECGFEPDRVVVSEGSFEEDVFLAQVVVCQEGGEACAHSKPFPFMGFFRDRDGAPELLGWVKLEGGCSSKATDDRRLLFRRATAAERSALPSRAGAPGAEARARDELVTASDRLEQGSFSAARDHFLLALSYEPGNLTARVGLGAAQVKLGEYRGAIEALSDASRRARDARADGLLGMAQYNLACAYARQGLRREALGALGEAVRLVGPAITDDVLGDRDLAPLHETPEYRRIAAQLRAARKAR
jgi:hypothetical protein